MFSAQPVVPACTRVLKREMLKGENGTEPMTPFPIAIFDVSGL